MNGLQERIKLVNRSSTVFESQVRNRQSKDFFSYFISARKGRNKISNYALGVLSTYILVIINW
jgi:hypothetical protein